MGDFTPPPAVLPASLPQPGEALAPIRGLPVPFEPLPLPQPFPVPPPVEPGQTTTTTIDEQNSSTTTTSVMSSTTTSAVVKEPVRR
jgi:hypothetical protein